MDVSERKKPAVLPQLEITDTGSEGQGIARSGNMVVFVAGAVPGDVVDVEVTRKKSNYREGKIAAFHKRSDRRTEPACEHFGICGGCKWQHMAYESQLFYKQKQVSDALSRIGKLQFPQPEKILPSNEIYFYRNKLEFSFSNKMWLTQEQISSGATFNNRNALGFHIPGKFDKVLDINQCQLQADPSNAIRNEIKKFALENAYEFFDIREQQGFLRNMIIRTANTGELMLIVAFFHKDEALINSLLSHIGRKFPEISSLFYVINPKKNDTLSDLNFILFSGKDHILEEMEELKFKVGPKSFYQTNSAQAFELYKVVRTFAGLTGTECVYDLYTGTGTIANFIAGRAARVSGIEYIPEAIEDAKENSRINNLQNTAFFAGDIKDVLSQEFIRSQGKPDVIITDPPRTGMHEDVVQKISETEASRIVYVSCNPATQARDLLILSPEYSIEAIQPVDMFPHTAHVENVVLMKKRR